MHVEPQVYVFVLFFKVVTILNLEVLFHFSSFIDSLNI